jgi:hypothetical protein
MRVLFVEYACSGALPLLKSRDFEVVGYTLDMKSTYSSPAISAAIALAEACGGLRSAHPSSGIATRLEDNHTEVAFK